MKYGFFRLAAASPKTVVADCRANASAITECVKKASSEGAKLIVFPELCITGYTCSDLFLQDTLQKNALSALELIAAKTADTDALISVGLPMSDGTALYNAAAVIFRGKVLAIVKKSFIPNYAEFYERRHFATGAELGAESREESKISLSGKSVPFGTRFIFKDAQNPLAAIGFEICEDLWVPLSPSTTLALSGATIIANLSASNEIIGKASYRRTLVSSQSAKTVSAYLYANAGNGESTASAVYSGHCIIAENGHIIAENDGIFGSRMVCTDIDLGFIAFEKRRTGSCAALCEVTEVPLSPADTKLERRFSPLPFVPEKNRSCHATCAARAVLLW